MKKTTILFIVVIMLLPVVNIYDFKLFEIPKIISLPTTGISIGEHKVTFEDENAMGFFQFAVFFVDFQYSGSGHTKNVLITGIKTSPFILLLLGISAIFIYKRIVNRINNRVDNSI